MNLQQFTSLNSVLTKFHHILSSSAFTTLQLQNTTIAGQRRNRLFQYADPTVNVSAGTASVEATDIIVQCGEVDDFDITMRIADLNTNGAQAWPTYVEIDPGSATRNLRYPDLAMYDTVPWFDCKSWAIEKRQPSLSYLIFYLPHPPVKR